MTQRAAAVGQSRPIGPFGDVRFTPGSHRTADISGGPVGAKSGQLVFVEAGQNRGLAPSPDLSSQAGR